ncbi:hypothetical protein ES703_73278 [subsurface metagenome]
MMVVHLQYTRGMAVTQAGEMALRLARVMLIVLRTSICIQWSAAMPVILAILDILLSVLQRPGYVLKIREELASGVQLPVVTGQRMIHSRGQCLMNFSTTI